MTERRRLLYLRVLALRSVSTGYEPHIQLISYLVDRGFRKARLNEGEINHLAWRYRRQISPELVPFVATTPPKVARP
jgi:hypothetical protein